MTYNRLSLLAFLFLIISTFTCVRVKDNVLFEDFFGPESQGELRQNIIRPPSPEGPGNEWKVLDSGYDPVSWKMVDEMAPDDPQKGFWVIPPDSAFLQQGGQSHNSVLFCRVPVPEEALHYDISFKQYRAGNDYIGYIIGAPEMELHTGIEFGYMTRVPGTDSTVNDAYVTGAFGEKMVPGLALLHSWAEHRIEVRDNWVAWYINDSLIGMEEFPGTSVFGYFGIRLKNDPNTRYDDVRIIVYREGRG